MKVFNPQWNEDMEVADEMASYMKEHGYEPWHTGGGCMAWRKDEREDGDAYTMITYVDVELGNWKDRDDPQWIVGRYKWDETEESWVCCEDGLTLARAVEVGNLLPEPKADEQRMIAEKDVTQAQAKGLTKEAAITLINAKYGKGDKWAQEQLERCLRNVEGPADAEVLREILAGEFGIQDGLTHRPYWCTGCGQALTEQFDVHSRTCPGEAPEAIYGVRQSLNCRKAIEIAKDLVAAKCGLKVARDWSPEAMVQAVETLQAILEQQGCEHLEGDGPLTTLMDIVIFG